MADQGWVIKDSDTLRMCWNLDPQRLPGLVDPTRSVFLGPTFGSVFQSFDLTYKDPMRWLQTYSEEAVSEDFYNIYSCEKASKSSSTEPGLAIDAKSRFTLRELLEDTTVQDTTNSTVWAWDEEQPLSKAYGGLTATPAIIKGWQFLGVRENLTADSKDLVWINQYDTNHQVFSTQVIRSTFQLNVSVIPQAERPPTLIPFNSSFWFNATKIRLPAPFLDMGRNCSWPNLDLGECICYKGKPLTEDFRQSLHEHRFCAGGGRYIWGFARNFVFIGLLLEVLWCGVCISLWVTWLRQSELNRYGRSATGNVRNILDMCEAINRELGSSTCWYTDRELREALGRERLVGYTIENKGDTLSRLSLMPMPHGQPRDGRLEIDPSRCYG
ncbi:hypothetical protein B0T24DRAFT_705625 [Lasiosphaeria ovina]|uniref:Uncharacterized protein n=1 Tax=Lasiosphaeria ovina TaxID=92902 RepID=A0AAE0N4Y4_9PEZI|nr:hypothetical protein B0T24DRAFT_705625 [Lasiosphaeria ovina]